MAVLLQLPLRRRAGPRLDAGIWLRRAKATCISCIRTQAALGEPLQHEPWCPVITGLTEKED